MKAAFIRLFTSMKAWTLILGLTVTGLAKWGVSVDATTQAEILGLFAILLAAQGAADHGKEAAQATADAAIEAAKITAAAPLPRAQVVTVTANAGDKAIETSASGNLETTTTTTRTTA